MFPDTVVDIDAELNGKVDDHLEVLTRSVAVMGRLKAD